MKKSNKKEKKIGKKIEEKNRKKNSFSWENENFLMIF